MRLLLLERKFRLSGEERMAERPIKDLVDSLIDMGADIEYEVSEGYPPLLVRADGLKGGTVHVRGNISSQYLTALLISGPYCKQPLHVIVDGDLISKPYIDLTIDIMRRFGILVDNMNYQNLKCLKEFMFLRGFRY